jgi:Zn finger protein HypA/HybF involved in hydrogenase expression
MHEHGLADRVLEAISAHCDDVPGSHPVAVTLVASEIAGLNQDSFQAALDHVCEHRGLPPISVTIETVELLGECGQCGEAQELTDELRCPACGTPEVRLCGGETLLVKTCTYS